MFLTRKTVIHVVDLCDSVKIINKTSLVDIGNKIVNVSFMFFFERRY